MMVVCFCVAAPAVAQVDYQSQIQPLFNEYCVACHGTVSGTDLSTYTATVTSIGELYGTGIVKPYQPEASPLLEKLLPDPTYGARMPLNREPLSEAQIDLIRQWIAEGARETDGPKDRLIVDRSENYQLLQNYPNPFESQTTMRIRSGEQGEYRLVIVSTNGTVVKQTAGRFDIGATEIPVDIRYIGAGIYYYRLLLVGEDERLEELSGRMTRIK